MSFFLYKPHVVGRAEIVTSPDVIIDHLFVDRRMRPVGLLSSEAWLQVEGEETSQAAYAIVALGGGALIGPAVVLGSGTVAIARKAWRLSYLDGHAERVALNGKTLADAGTPADQIEAAAGSGDALPRGFLLVRTVEGNVRSAELVDPVLGRSLSHRVVLEQMETDRWGEDRPAPRYSVGPTGKDVQHFT